jgi:hypothetical protein
VRRRSSRLAGVINRSAPALDWTSREHRTWSWRLALQLHPPASGASPRRYLSPATATTTVNVISGSSDSCQFLNSWFQRDSICATSSPRHDSHLHKSIRKFLLYDLTPVVCSMECLAGNQDIRVCKSLFFLF